MAKRKKTTHLIYLLVFLIVLATLVFAGYSLIGKGTTKSYSYSQQPANVSLNNTTEPDKQPQVVLKNQDKAPELVQPAEPDIYVSSYKIKQADTLLIIARNEPNDISGKFGAINLHFFRSQNQKNWIAITGVPVNKTPGNYNLLIQVKEKTEFKKTVFVAKRDFPITALTVTPELVAQGYNDQSIVNNIINTENKDLATAMSVYTATNYSAKPFDYPLDEIKITGDFGDIRKSGSYEIQHMGVDLRALMDTPVYAVNDGKVVLEKNYTDYGNMIIIDHGLGVFSLYLHLDSFKVRLGQMVKQGEVIGLSGETGYAVGPHLHFSIKVRGVTLDPLEFVKTTQLAQ